MSKNKTFRTALNGFNREDVVHYIEYINAQHAAQVNQLTAELEQLRNQSAAPAENPALQETVEQLREENARLEERLQAMDAQRVELEEELQAALAEKYQAVLDRDAARANQVTTQSRMEEELEAYRRAERAERIAKERVAQLYDQANGALADATVRTDETATQICAAADAVIAQLTELQDLLRQGKITMKDAATAMYAIRPVLTEE